MSVCPYLSVFLCPCVCTSVSLGLYISLSTSLTMGCVPGDLVHLPHVDATGDSAHCHLPAPLWSPRQWPCDPM